MNTWYKFLAGIIILGLGMTACSKMDHTYSHFLENGEIIYTGRVDSIALFPGRNRIKISWLLISDPKVSMCRVYWNDGLDSVNVPIQRTTGTDTISVIVDSLQEGSYNFFIYTYDQSGHSSVESDTVGQVYGSNYESSLHTRAIRDTFWVNDTAFIKWYDSEKGSIGSTVKYLDNNSQTREVHTLPSDTVTALPGYKLKSSFSYQTFYLPDSLAIDTFYSSIDSLAILTKPKAEPVNLASQGELIDQSSNCSCGYATTLIDGDMEASNHWQPNSSDRRDDLEIWVMLDLGKSLAFNEMQQYWQKGNNHVDGYKILYSDDKQNWNTAYESSTGPGSDKTTSSFPEVAARYVKLVWHFGDDGNVNITEIELYDR